ncbi:hypothetical protein [Bacteriovorax sp. Seq25_V]|uniref:hypothetical protein n=1 Tax=Bacteriovorax sp. Seq25_V TaxID=1201288 RepID=UPI000389E3D0|nr:hypothetical protein [Bacteriovorax sp. Seq25_V]EQC46242.1 hypothetical protein M900_1774 [Bacteriovorax sp. Seq25_V]
MKKLVTFAALVLSINSFGAVTKGKNWVIDKHEVQNELVRNLTANQDCFLESINDNSGEVLLKIKLEADEFDANNEFVAKTTKATDRIIKLKLSQDSKSSEYTIDLYYENMWDRHDTSRAISSDLQAFKVGVESRNFSGTGFFSEPAHTFFYCK